MAALRDLPKPSVMRRNRKGDKGSPCLIPREGLKGPEGTPLTRIDKNALETRLSIQAIHFVENPKASNMRSRKFQ